MHCIRDRSELCNWRQNPLLHAPQDRHRKGLQGGIVQCSFREDSCRQGKYWSADANHHWHYMIAIFTAGCWGDIEALFEFVVFSQASKHTAMFFTKADVGL